MAGVRTNQLVGYGLVVGLDGTGDQTSQTPFTIQSITNMLAKFGVPIPPGTNAQLKNVAAVTVTADLPAFAKAGQTIDITVSSIGNATSLRGGSLLDDAAARCRRPGVRVRPGQHGRQRLRRGRQGRLARSRVNVPSSGRIPNGATVEREVPVKFGGDGHLVFNLHTPDFTTAARVVNAINKILGAGTAEALDAVSIRVAAPIGPEPAHRLPGHPGSDRGRSG